MDETTNGLVVEEIASEQKLTDNQMKLSDGRIVEMREQKGSDEMVVAGILGNLYSNDGSGMIIYTNSLMVRTIVSINGQPVQPMRKFAEIRDFMDTFKTRDWNKLRMKYLEINGFTVDDATEGNGKE